MVSFPLLSSGKSSSTLTACHWLTAWVNYHLHFGPITLLYLSTGLCFPSFLLHCFVLLCLCSLLEAPFLALLFLLLSDWIQQKAGLLGSTPISDNFTALQVPPESLLYTTSFLGEIYICTCFLVNCRSLLKANWYKTDYRQYLQCG